MFKIQLKTNLTQFQRGLADFQKRQVPFAAATALNSIAVGVQADIVQSMKDTFDQPTPYTLRAIYAKKASKADLRAFVGIREFAGKGTPAWKYLGPHATGGERRQKRFEKALQATNQALPYALPGRGATLDQYGNISAGQLTQVLSALGAFAEGGYRANITANSSKKRVKAGMLLHSGSWQKRSDLFIAKSKSTGKPLGVYQLVKAGTKRSPGVVEPILIFTDRTPRYKADWPINDIVLKAINHYQRGAFERAWAQALATAR